MLVVDRYIHIEPAVRVAELYDRGLGVYHLVLLSDPLLPQLVRDVQKRVQHILPGVGLREGKCNNNNNIL